MDTLELWGGAECTVNRIGDRFSDQTILTGHETRRADIAAFASLGLKALRYPVLWERIERRPGARDFAWTDERLAEIRRHGLRAIAGLVHHGSGPAWTNLLDDGFAPGLAAHARAVAERYPHLDAYTPVNEPLTTARFACLYGHWAPHVRDETAMWRAVLNQIDAVRAAMREVRRVNPAAQLVQTEDLGFTHAAPPLAYQAAHENDRRWITWDLLDGAVTRDHPLHARLVRFGFADRLAAIADDPCPADIIGVNHYLTSERFLDASQAYPPHMHGGNGRDAYVDVEAVRARHPGPHGLETILAETARRYARPVALTECHNGSSRDEQMRWFAEAWRACARLRASGAPIVACTAWSLVGAVDWCSLLTQERGRYECGVFNVRGGGLRETAMAGLLRDLAAGRPPAASWITDAPGWWRRPGRFLPQRAPAGPAPAAPKPSVPGSMAARRRPILILGATGTLGQAVARACEARALPHRLVARDECPLDDRAALIAALRAIRPVAVVNAAGYVRVDAAEKAPDDCHRANAAGAIDLAAVCAAIGAPCVNFSSDLVFDGAKGALYLETDPPAPVNVYGASKAALERALADAPGRNLVVRTAAFFQAADPHNFAVAALGALAAGATVRAPDDFFVSPTHVPDLVNATLDLLIDGGLGVWHLANVGRVSWAQFARDVATAAGFDPARVEPCAPAVLGWTAPRPRDVALGAANGAVLGSLEEAIARFAADWRAQRAA